MKLQFGEETPPLWRRGQISPARVIILGFLLLIFGGTLLLMLPWSTRTPGGANFLDALFTSTSATCVTGLVVHDTVGYWSGFGQAVILLLIQIGGMGVVTVAVALFIFSGRRIGLKERWVMQESISAPQVGGIIRMTGFILRTALIIEGVGALLLALRFCPQFGLWKGIWYGVFHGVSAFCNAGFDLMGSEVPYSSLTAYGADPLVCVTVALLIIVGGIGFSTWQDIAGNGCRLRQYRLQSKLILLTTFLLLLAGTLYFACYEFRLPQWADMDPGERVLAAFFQSASPRTAGFNTVDLTQMSELGRLVTILLMLTGGSPGSTAGGFKTTTLAVLLLSAWAVFRRRSSAECFGRRLPEAVLRNASAIFWLYLTLFFLGGALICCIDGVALLDALFESASAIGTVGLSIVGTANLSAPSRLILIFLMYFGRVGGLTMIYAVTAGTLNLSSQYPQESVTVG
ncbi:MULTISPECIES: TrkH family potassium uptake protein [environmental samples]|uniref:TrkH family potassium uptake protein n=1 Tax=environmental samples TaxID=876090 RepID=UPI000334FE19|nr:MULTISPECIES: potassium transporter TrkG [environmental samples]CDC72171.1 ktr system potassium uptake protein KtrB [Oscillibacter sp. CAG:155]